MMDLSFIINELGEERENYFNAVAPPIIQTSNFAYKTVKELRAVLQEEDKHPFYSRGVNPTIRILAKKLAALEKCEDALLFSSGSAAIAAAVLGNIKSGDHIICIKKPYGWTNKLMTNLLPKFGISVTMVEGTDNRNIEKALQPNTRLLYLESPNSFTFEIQDLEWCGKFAREHKLISIIDNSYSTPLNQNPVDYGIDIIVHSCSKYLSGHSDLVAGVLCSSTEMATKIFKSEFMTLGGIISPMNAWLVIRGLRTLPLRMERSAQTADQIIPYLENNPKVAQVYFPFSKSNLQYDLAKKQMKQCPSLFSILLKTENLEEIERFCNSFERMLLACSWGGHESLLYPVCAFYDSTNYSTSTLPVNLIRFYIGLEEPEAILNDFEKAFSTI